LRYSSQSFLTWSAAGSCSCSTRQFQSRLPRCELSSAPLDPLACSLYQGHWRSPDLYHPLCSLRPTVLDSCRDFPIAMRLLPKMGGSLHSISKTNSTFLPPFDGDHFPFWGILVLLPFFFVDPGHSNSLFLPYRCGLPNASHPSVQQIGHSPSRRLVPPSRLAVMKFHPLPPGAM